MMSAEYLMGVDLGTSSLKTMIIDFAGRTRAIVSQDYPLSTPQPGWVEQDPGEWVRAAVQTMKLALEKAGIRGDQIAGIGLSGQMHGLVCLGHGGEALRPAIIWADQRSQAQVEKVYAEIGREQLGQWTGNPLATGFMLASWLWMREHEPETVRQTANLLLPKDYLRYVLTGEIGTEPSDASSTLLFDTVNCRWSEPLLAQFDIDPRILPEVHASTEIAGGLRKSIAGQTGLPAGTPVVFGGSDQAMQAVGNGVLDPGVASSTIGTGGQLFAPVTRPVYDKSLRLHLFCHAVPGTWHLEAAILAAGLAFKWLRDNVVRNVSFNTLADMAASVPPGAEGLYFLPHLVGERTPHMDPQARAAFIGLTLGHNREHLARAVMEGVVMQLRQGMQIMRQLGCTFDQLVASGGGRRHPLWLQLQADILNTPLRQTETVEAAAMGAALAAGVGAGVYADIQTACRQTIRWGEEATFPIREHVERYDEIFDHFSRIYPALKSMLA